MSRKIAGSKATSGVCTYILRRNPWHCRIARHPARQNSHGAHWRDAHQKILHEVAWTQVEGVEAFDTIEFQFHVMQTDDGAGLLRVLCADAAQCDGIWNVCIG